jgi:hypothetical protein
MSMQNHLAELERRHQSLEKQIEAANTSPSASDLELAELKRRKLVLKDEIQKLREGNQSRLVH